MFASDLRRRIEKLYKVLRKLMHYFWMPDQKPGCISRQVCTPSSALLSIIFQTINVHHCSKVSKFTLIFEVKPFCCVYKIGRASGRERVLRLVWMSVREIDWKRDVSGKSVVLRL